MTKGPKSKHKVHLHFTCILFIHPEGNFTYAVSKQSDYAPSQEVRSGIPHEASKVLGSGVFWILNSLIYVAPSTEAQL